jgi:hypothetical protein
MSKEATVVVSVRMPRSLADRYTTIADAEDLTRNHVIVSVLKRGVHLARPFRPSRRSPKAQLSAGSRKAASASLVAESSGEE